ncbi:protein phosphatase methylesterase [Multifurca ochricompacta]|uniref:Protein phosphatase methylesterase 1 n=1 Tax=Multifurca ochricompacta TaxID=376703 RepID=A0AAD4M8K6_9AGAM|nr:protein phosphatase methylesterase [Multifurca ochricompacta]
MSDLYRSAMYARISKLPQLPPDPPGHEDEEAADSIGALPSLSLSPPINRLPRTPNPEYAPVSGASYFSQAVQVDVPASKLDVRVYYTPPQTTDGSAGSVIVCHHGAGFAGLSFALFAKEVTKLAKGELGILSIDARRHGAHSHIATLPIERSFDEDLSLDILVQDLHNLLRVVFPVPSVAPSLLLVGHSMGGAVIVRVVPLLIEAKYRVSGVAVLDVVEGTALDALPHMPAILNSRPEGFDSVSDAIEWHITAHQIRNITSARVSVPSLVIPTPEPRARGVRAFTWRTPLRTTAPYWEGWFKGLSAAFLAARTARLLVLAGTERLDRELMIGQMQGKFQLVVVPNTGHMLHEDDPLTLAQTLVEFWRRNERVVVGIKKVGDL